MTPRSTAVTVPEETVLSWLTSLSNWGRWGVDDQLGTLNLVTDESRRAAAASVVDGRVVSCALPIVTRSQAGDLHGAPHRFMVRTGQGLRDANRVGTSGAFATTSPRLHPAAEYLALTFHGPNITHLDALCHQSWDAHMYNGRPAEAVTTELGATELSVLAAADGIVTRGVLLDVARARGLDWLPPGYGVHPEEIEELEEELGIRVGRGDAVLLRTGFGRARRELGAAALTEPWAGWHASMLPWFKDREVSVIGSDTFNEALPNGYVEATLPMHAVGIVAMGLWLLDNCDLEAVGDYAALTGRPTFLLTLAPLPIEGGTGSPVNPLAMF